MAKSFDFAEMQVTVHETAKSHGWWDKPDTVDTVPAKLALIAGEAVGEALEDYRANPFEISHIHYDVTNKPVGFPIELADVVIRTMDLAERLGIDLARAIQVKAEYNDSREYRHGGKAV